MKNLKTITILRMLGSTLSFPIWLLLFSFISGSFDFISKTGLDYGFGRAAMIILVLFTNIFIWAFYDKEKG
jgi:hypothetical protein